MKLLVQDKLFRLILYCQVLVGFSFRQPGIGIVNPAHPFLLTSLFLFCLTRKKAPKVFGDNASWIVILSFLTVLIISALITLSQIEGTSAVRPVGVIVSLLSFLLFYYISSRVNRNIEKTSLFLNIFINVCLIHSGLTILDFLLHSLTGQSYFYLVLKGTLSALRFPNAENLNDFNAGGRYKGLLVESGDVGDYVTPGLAAMFALLFFGKTRKLRSCLLKIALMLSATIICGSASALQEVIIVLNLSLLVFFSKFTSIGKLRKNQLFLSVASYAFLGVMSAIATVSLLVYFKDYLPIFVQDRIYSILNYSADSNSDSTTNLSVQVLINCYNAAIYTIYNSPLLGYGAGFFSIPFDRALEQMGSGFEVTLNRDDGYSMFLRLIGEGGIIGLLLFLSIFIARLSQVKNFIGIQILCKDSKEYSMPYSINEVVVMTFAAASSSLLHILLNKGSYWVPITPILLGLFVKSTFKSQLLKGKP